MRVIWQSKGKRKHIVIPEEISSDVQKLAMLLDQKDHRILRLLEEIDDPRSF